MKGSPEEGGISLGRGKTLGSLPTPQMMGGQWRMKKLCCNRKNIN